MQIDISIYPQLALLTESNNFDSIRERLTKRDTLLVNSLEAFSLVAETLDVNKKQIFYGKNFVADQELGKDLPPLSNEAIRLLHAILGIATEAGELVDAFLKFAKGEKSWEDTLTNCMEESCDVEWYQNILRAITLILEEVEKNANLNKLLVKRYGLTFDADKAANRNLNEELKVLANPFTIRDDQPFIVNVGDVFIDRHVTHPTVSYKCVITNDRYAILESDDSVTPVILKTSASFVPAFTKNEYINPICAVPGPEGKPVLGLRFALCGVDSVEN